MINAGGRLYDSLFFAMSWCLSADLQTQPEFWMLLDAKPEALRQGGQQVEPMR